MEVIDPSHGQRGWRERQPLTTQRTRRMKGTDLDGKVTQIDSEWSSIGTGATTSGRQSPAQAQKQRIEQLTSQRKRLHALQTSSDGWNSPEITHEAQAQRAAPARKPAGSPTGRSDKASPPRAQSCAAATSAIHASPSPSLHSTSSPADPRVQPTTRSAWLEPLRVGHKSAQRISPKEEVRFSPSFSSRRCSWIVLLALILFLCSSCLQKLIFALSLPVLFRLRDRSLVKVIDASISGIAGQKQHGNNEEIAHTPMYCVQDEVIALAERARQRRREQEQREQEAEEAESSEHEHTDENDAEQRLSDEPPPVPKQLRPLSGSDWRSRVTASASTRRSTPSKEFTHTALAAELDEDDLSDGGVRDASDDEKKVQSRTTSSEYEVNESSDYAKEAKKRLHRLWSNRDERPRSGREAAQGFISNIEQTTASTIQMKDKDDSKSWEDSVSLEEELEHRSKDWEKITIEHRIVAGTELDLSHWSSITRRRARKIARVVHQRQLRTLTLPGVDISPDALHEIAKCNASLRSLDLRNCSLGEEHVVPLQQLFSNRAASHGTHDESHPSEAMVAHLATETQPDKADDGPELPNSMLHVQLDNNVFSDRSASRAIAFLRGCKHVCLSSCGIGPLASQEVGWLLLSDVDSLDLSWNHCGAPLASSVAHALSSGAKVASLNLSACGLRDNDASRIFDAMMDATCLKTLHLSDNIISLPAFNALAHTLRSGSVPIEHVSLQRTSPGQEGCGRVIRAAAARSQTRVTLDIFGCSLQRSADTQLEGEPVDLHGMHRLDVADELHQRKLLRLAQLWQDDGPSTWKSAWLDQKRVDVSSMHSSSFAKSSWPTQLPKSGVYTIAVAPPVPSPIAAAARSQRESQEDDWNIEEMPKTLDDTAFELVWHMQPAITSNTSEDFKLAYAHVLVRSFRLDATQAWSVVSRSAPERSSRRTELLAMVALRLRKATDILELQSLVKPLSDWSAAIERQGLEQIARVNAGNPCGRFMFRLSTMAGYVAAHSLIKLVQKTAGHKIQLNACNAELNGEPIELIQRHGDEHEHEVGSSAEAMHTSIPSFEGSPGLLVFDIVPEALNGHNLNNMSLPQMHNCSTGEDAQPSPSATSPAAEYQQDASNAARMYGKDGARPKKLIGNMRALLQSLLEKKSVEDAVKDCIENATSSGGLAEDQLDLERTRRLFKEAIPMSSNENLAPIEPSQTATQVMQHVPEQPRVEPHLLQKAVTSACAALKRPGSQQPQIESLGPKDALIDEDSRSQQAIAVLDGEIMLQCNGAIAKAKAGSIIGLQSVISGAPHAVSARTSEGSKSSSKSKNKVSIMRIDKRLASALYAHSGIVREAMDKVPHPTGNWMPPVPATSSSKSTSSSNAQQSNALPVHQQLKQWRSQYTCTAALPLSAPDPPAASELERIRLAFWRANAQTQRVNAGDTVTIANPMQTRSVTADTSHGGMDDAQHHNEAEQLRDRKQAAATGNDVACIVTSGIGMLEMDGTALCKICEGNVFLASLGSSFLLRASQCDTLEVLLAETESLCAASEGVGSMQSNFDRCVERYALSYAAMCSRLCAADATQQLSLRDPVERALGQATGHVSWTEREAVQLLSSGALPRNDRRRIPCLLALWPGLLHCLQQNRHALAMILACLTVEEGYMLRRALGSAAATPRANPSGLHRLKPKENATDAAVLHMLECMRDRSGEARPIQWAAIDGKHISTQSLRNMSPLSAQLNKNAKLPQRTEVELCINLSDSAAEHALASFTQQRDATQPVEV